VLSQGGFWNQWWWYTPIIPAFRRQREEDSQIEASLGKTLSQKVFLKKQDSGIISLISEKELVLVNITHCSPRVGETWHISCVFGILTLYSKVLRTKWQRMANVRSSS
jgi:hypothetical protein